MIEYTITCSKPSRYWYLDSSCVTFQYSEEWFLMSILLLVTIHIIDTLWCTHTHTITITITITIPYHTILLENFYLQILCQSFAVICMINKLFSVGSAQFFWLGIQTSIDEVSPVLHPSFTCQWLKTGSYFEDCYQHFCYKVAKYDAGQWHTVKNIWSILAAIVTCTWNHNSGRPSGTFQYKNTILQCRVWELAL